MPVERDHSQALKTSGPIIGAIPEAHFHAAQTQVAAGSVLYLFSDGVFEIRSGNRQWRLADFVPFLTQPIATGNECRRLYDEVKSVCRGGPPDDDFSMLVVTFP